MNYCQYCGARIVRGKDGNYVHDQRLSQLKVTPAEVAAVRVNAEANRYLPKEKRRYAALHAPKPKKD